MISQSTVRPKNDWGAFLASLVLALPSTVALFSALALRSDVAWLPAPGTWFIYLTSRYVAYLAIVISGGIVVAETTRHPISRKCVLLTGLALVGAVLLLWGAVRIFNKTTW